MINYKLFKLKILMIIYILIIFKHNMNNFLIKIGRIIIINFF
jgi:type III secretory pathway component EscS